MPPRILPPLASKIQALYQSNNVINTSKKDGCRTGPT
ncbi:hypothetical protein H206_05418 [Candidatus Electrothrix aarhusensis]|uniref:Uncharacterized protein n=1 Tax=Candidatus Electrothrix aarhusensis TaxID=1859131 RepID=A0A444J4M6_9BACT|nr:hypothetical protein H206_05418 [Candidatus Electrothrix aarhusensis]